ERGGEAGERDADRAPHRFRVEAPDLRDPAQREAALDSDEEVLGDPRKDRQRDRDDEERAHREREPELEPPAEPPHPAAATPAPASERAPASAAHVMRPSTIDNDAAIEKFA